MTAHTSGSANGLGFLIVLGAAASISLASVLMPVFYGYGGNPATLVFFRMALVMPVCALWLWRSGISFAMTSRHRMHGIVIGLIYTTGTFSLSTAFETIPVSLAILVFYTYPLLTRLVECALDRRRPRLSELGFLLTALFGLALCLGVSTADLAGTGLLFSMLAAFCLSSSFLWAGRKLASVHPMAQMYVMAWTGLVVTFVLNTTLGAWALPSHGLVPWTVLAATVALATAATLGMFTGVKLIGPSRTAMVMNVEPVFAVLLAMIILNESMSPLQILGGAIVVASVFIGQTGPIWARHWQRMRR